MSWRAGLMAIAAAAVLAAAFVPTEASARHRHRGYDWRGPVVGLALGLAPEDFCGGRLPAYGYDACGFREFSHGPGSCWRRAVYRPDRPYPRRVWICG